MADEKKPKKKRQRYGPVQTTFSRQSWVNAPNETLRHIIERIEKRIFTDRTNEETCALLAAAYREIIAQRNIIKRIDRRLTAATQQTLFAEDA